MSMLHVRSRDVVSGDLYSGKWSLTSNISGSLEVLYHHIEAGSIPYMYPLVNGLLVEKVSDGTQYLITFGQYEDASSAQVILDLGGDFTTAMGGDFVSITYDLDTDAYSVTFSEDFHVYWSTSSLSTSSIVFNKSEDETGTVIILDGVYINDRPKFLQFHLDESSSQGITSGNVKPDLIISTEDELVLGQSFEISNVTQDLNIKIYRENSIIPVPMSLHWDIIFKVSAS